MEKTDVIFAGIHSSIKTKIEVVRGYVRTRYFKVHLLRWLNQYLRLKYQLLSKKNFFFSKREPKHKNMYIKSYSYTQLAQRGRAKMHYFLVFLNRKLYFCSSTHALFKFRDLSSIYIMIIITTSYCILRCVFT